MNLFNSFLFLTLLFLPNKIQAQSALLESVKRNPQEAKELCNRFKELNSQGISANSDITLQEVANKKNLSKLDAEILSMYVIGLNCPDVK
tara:strand:- start:2943 stop:3212 length:270 start_codon:yes stop_codon:yes gene_type:complete